MKKKEPNPSKHRDDKKINKAGKRTKGQDRSASKGGSAADKDAENALRKFFKGL